jgi:hypothetical protein
VRSARAVRRVVAALAGATALAGGAVWAPAALGAEVQAEADGVQAAFTYEEGVAGAPLPYSSLRLRISREGTSYYEAPVSSHYCGSLCEPEPLGGGPLKSSPLTIADLEGDGVPQVVLALSTGGAHCCTVVQVFSYDPGVMVYRPIERDFGDPGALLSDLAGDGRLELETADDRFAYEFAPYAYSGLPLQVWQVHEDHFVNVTRQFPQQIAADATRQLHRFMATRREGLGNGLIAAWAADQELLGHRRLVAHRLAREAARGNLRSREHYGPSGDRFVKALMGFLRTRGYLPR